MNQDFPYLALAFYRFSAIEASELESISAALNKAAAEHDICGLIILATEGINGTIAGLASNVQIFREIIASFPWAEKIEFKTSPSHFQPFRRFKVNIRSEIVTSKSPDLIPNGKHRHLSPEEWHEWLSSENPPLLIDTRNDYESRIGTFKGAITPAIKKFHEF